MNNHTTIQISPELHYEIKLQALKTNKKVWEWVQSAVEFKLRSEGIFLDDYRG